MIHLKHAIHGYHIVYTELDAQKHEKLGWKRCDIKKEWEEARKAKEKAAKQVDEEKKRGEAIAKRVANDKSRAD